MCLSYSGSVCCCCWCWFPVSCRRKWSFRRHLRLPSSRWVFCRCASSMMRSPSISIPFIRCESVGIFIWPHPRFSCGVAFILAVSAAIVSAVHTSLRTGSTVVSILGCTRSCPRCLASVLTVHPVFVSASSIRMLCRMLSGSLPIHQMRSTVLALRVSLVGTVVSSEKPKKRKSKIQISSLLRCCRRLPT